MRTDFVLIKGRIPLPAVKPGEWRDPVNPMLVRGRKTRFIKDDETGDWTKAPLGPVHSDEWTYSKGEYRGRIERYPVRVELKDGSVRVLPEYRIFLRHQKEDGEELLGTSDGFEEAREALQRELDVLTGVPPQEEYPLEKWMQTEVY